MDISDKNRLQEISDRTVALAVYLVRYYIGEVSVENDMLQLVGVSCLLIASKLIDLKSITVYDMIDITVKKYTRNQIIEMECSILYIYGIDLFVPTTFDIIYELSAMHDNNTRDAALLYLFISYHAEIYNIQPKDIAATCLIYSYRINNVEHVNSLSQKHLIISLKQSGL